MALEMIPADFSIEEADNAELSEAEAHDQHELTTVRSGESDQRALPPHLLERLADILGHEKNYLQASPDLASRRDWQTLRAWKSLVTREQLPLIAQLLKYPLFFNYANFLLGRPSAPFVDYLQSREPTQGEVDEMARWQSLQLSVVSSRSVSDPQTGANFIGYNVICELKSDHTNREKAAGQTRSRTWVACKRFSEFYKLYGVLRAVHKSLAKLKFPGRTMVKSDTSDKVVLARQEALNSYLQGVMDWVRQESPWTRGETVSREWVKCTEALEAFLAVSEMAPRYPKCNSRARVDCDLALHPSLREDHWLTDLQRGEVTELYVSHARVSLQAFAYLFENAGCGLSLADLVGACSDPEEFAAFLESLAGAEGLRRLYLSHVAIGEAMGADTVAALVDLVAKGALEVLLLSGWEMGRRLQGFASALAKTARLQVLDLSHCGIVDIQTGMVELCSALRTCGVRELYLDENPFGDDGAKLLAVALRQNPALEMLSAKFCKITPFGLMKILDALDSSTASTGASDAATLCNSNLLRLYLADMSMETDDFAVVKDLAICCGSMLENNASLQALDLSGHYFDTEAGLIMMRALQGNVALRKLVLSYTKRNWDSSAIFLEFFQSNKGVQSLQLRNSMASNEQAGERKEEMLSHLKYSIPNDEVLRELFAWNMVEPMCELLCRGLESNSALVLLDLQAMLLTDRTAAALAKLLQHNTTLQELLVRTTPDVELEELVRAVIGSNVVALTLSNLSRAQGELLLSCLDGAPRHMPFQRISLSFTNGTVHCDIWEHLDALMQAALKSEQPSSLLFS